MTTEQALRAALSSLIEDYEGVEDMLDADTLGKLNAARAALALPAPEVTLEYRVAYMYQQQGRKKAELNHILATSESDAKLSVEALTGKAFDVAIQSRAAAGPWLPVVQP